MRFSQNVPQKEETCPTEEGNLSRRRRKSVPLKKKICPIKEEICPTEGEKSETPTPLTYVRQRCRVILYEENEVQGLAIGTICWGNILRFNSKAKATQKQKNKSYSPWGEKHYECRSRRGLT